MHRISADSRLSLGSLHRSFTKQLVSMPQEAVGFAGLTRMFHESKKAEGISKVKQRITPRLEVQYNKIQEGLPKQRCTSAWESHKLRDGGGFRAFEKMTRNTADVEFPLELFTDVSDLTSLQGRMEREDIKVYFVGVDEVGRGPLAGPVVAAACAMALHHREVLESTSNSSWYSRIQDSKKMRDSERKRCYEAIKCASLLPNPVVQIATAERSAREIDQTNILQCTLDCMVECAAKVIKSVLETNDAKLKSLKQSRKNRLCFVLLIDGNILPSSLKRSGPCDLILKELKGVKNPTRVQPDTVSEDVSTLHDSDTLSSDQSNEASFIALPIIQGDASCISIAAASIVAKEVRDEYMRELHLQYSQFGFDAHKGYPTPAHLQTLKKHAPCRDHRFSFAPVREASILHSCGEQDVC